jgi:tetratricopeptide (TPR) repeat protein
MSIRGRTPPVWLGGLIVLLVFLAYLPALHGGFIWDDDSWTTNLSVLFQNTSGLRLIWFQPTALQQYYPLSGTTFWLDYQLWKFWTTPYHVENVLLHALAALLFWRLLLQLQLPGAWLAGALFALHPVMVESVAWITERKNVLSLALYLGAWLAYLRYAQGVTGDPPSPRFRLRPASARQAGAAGGGHASPVTRHPSFFYGLAFVLFLCALLAKTTAFSLPAVILLIGWWQRGKIRWRADVLPTLPFFALALGLCAVTAWLEECYLCAQGSDFALTFPQRCLVAGRVFWFYLGKLFWPANLCFVYPRWQPNPASGWQWLHPVTAIGALFTLWLARRRIGRGPVTSLVYFVGTLFPVLGFMNAYGMRYSFVWDHWVYLPALGIIALVAALVVRAAEWLRTPAVVYGFAAIVLPVFALLTWRQAAIYTDMETLWRDTLVKNPDCWMAHNNLGLLLSTEGRMEEAMEHYHKAIQINPNYSDAPNSLGIALAAQGWFDEAIENFRKAIQVEPNNFKVLNNLGIALGGQGRFDEAIENYYKAIQINPNYFEALNNLGATLATQGRFDEAIKNYRQAIRINPNYAKALNNLGIALANKGRFDEAIESFRKAIQINSNYAEALNNLARMLATSPDDELRNGAEAVHLAERACELTHYGEPLFIGTLAAAYAESGRSPEAVTTAEKAEQLATSAGLTAVAAKNRQLLELYRAGKPYHEPAPTVP